MKRLLHFSLISQQSKADEAIGKFSHLQIRKLNKILLIFLLSVSPFSRLFSNNLNVSIVSGGIDQANGKVTFDLSWNNSWRDPNTAAKNWDAAWIFVKWRSCTASADSQFTHGLVSTTLSDHTFNGSPNTHTFEPTLADGSVVGIDPAPDNTGVMLRNAASTSPNNYGNVSARITLKFLNMPTTGTLNVKVFGIEMVFIPSASSWSLGDGNGTNYSSSSLGFSSTTSKTAISLTTENAITVYEQGGQLICPSGACALSAAFPKGVNPFYIMKYEISQGAYKDFLNTTSALAQSIHFPNQSGINRHAINLVLPQDTFNTIIGSVDKKDRACNFLSWADVGSYLAWTALRPLTEIEYEKACRGTFNPASYEAAYGQASAIKATGIKAPEDGTDTVNTPAWPNVANIAAGQSVNYTGGDGGQGPLRGGIFATSANNTRVGTGAGFYGAMELSGNVEEYYISAQAGITNAGVTSNGINLGTGMLSDSTGQFTDYGWPNAYTVATSNNGKTNSDIIRKGGTYATSFNTPFTSSYPLSVSYRTVSSGVTIASREAGSGGRGGRSPSSGSSGGYVSGSQQLNYTGSLQYFRVPDGVTALTIDAYGAGGAGTYAGRGAEMKGLCTVIPGEVLQVLVGNTGVTAGGGGGTFVVRAPYNTLNSVLVVAGGGGGCGHSSVTTPQAQRDGQIGTTGGNSSGTGGSNGNGGNVGNTGTSGGGGGGFLSQGGNGNQTGGFSFISGGAGGNNGGFGGGGGASASTTGGGGGGYSGGGAGYSGTTSTYSGGGGGSIINGVTLLTIQTGTPVNTAGKVIFTW